MPVPVPLTGLALEPFAPRRIALSSLLAGPLNGAAGAMCSGQFTFTGPPGHVTGRYYAASESKVYGAYVKLEPFVGRAYSEVYWTTEEDFVPILTVTNFSEEEDDIEIYISRRERLALLHSEPLAPGASLTVNVRELLERLRTEGKFTDEYGGSYIRTRKPTGKLMVKQHSISQRRLMMAPYYGGYDYVYAHWFTSAPDTVDVHTSSSNASVRTCYAISGCINNEWFIYSSNDSILQVQNTHGVLAPRPLLGVSVGSANLDSTASGYIDEYGTQGWLTAYHFSVQVKPRCFAQLKYRPVELGPIITDFNHAFWWIQRSTASQQEERWVLAGGPSVASCVPNCGYLRSYPVQGDVGHFPADNPSASLHWASALASAVCSAVTNMFNAAHSWPQSQFQYQPGGPNSNTFARMLADIAPFSVSAPPNSPGW